MYFARKLFKGIAGNLEEKRSQKRLRLVKFGKDLFQKLGRPLSQEDFKGKDRPSIRNMIDLFGSFSTYISTCGLNSKKRKSNMPNDEMKIYLSGIKNIVTRNTTYPNCWETTKYSLGTDGKPRIRIKNRMLRIHQASYIIFNSCNLKRDKEISHLCHNPVCFNPKHLVQESHEENIKRGGSPRKKMAKGSKRLPQRKYGVIKSINDTESIMRFVLSNCVITEPYKQYIWQGSLGGGAPVINIKGKSYRLPKLVLAIKLDKKYSEVRGVTRHKLPDGSRSSSRDLNPEHLFEELILKILVIRSYTILTSKWQSIMSR